MNTINRISELFKSDKKDLLSIYFCAGAPILDNTADVIISLEQHGVNMVEIGLPFSDPMADGPIIQNAATKALKNGMNLKFLFSQLKDIRKTVRIPLVIMGYLNPIFQYGFENFCRSCNECGIDGCIIPDLPFDIYIKEFKATAEKFNINVIMLITPETEENRIRQIDENTLGFIYMVSSASTTGAQKDFSTAKRNYFKRIHDMHLKNSLMVGFGISNKSTFSAACEFARGGIIGSQFVSLLEEEQNPNRAIERLTESLT